MCLEFGPHSWLAYKFETTHYIIKIKVELGRIPSTNQIDNQVLR